MENKCPFISNRSSIHKSYMGNFPLTQRQNALDSRCTFQNKWPVALFSNNSKISGKLCTSKFPSHNHSSRVAAQGYGNEYLNRTNEAEKNILNQNVCNADRRATIQHVFSCTIFTIRPTTYEDFDCLNLKPEAASLRTSFTGGLGCRKKDRLFDITGMKDTSSYNKIMIHQSSKPVPKWRDRDVVDRGYNKSNIIRVPGALKDRTSIILLCNQ